MKPLRHALRKLTVTYSKSDLLAVSLVAASVAVWSASAAGSASFALLFACEAAFFSFYLVGSLLAACSRLATGVLFDLPLRLLSGYAVVNSALLVSAWLSPLGMVLNFGVLASIATVLFFAAGERKLQRGDHAALWAIGLCLLATTLWCQDSIRPTRDEGAFLVFKPWVDGFYHSVHIRIFADSHGASSIEDFRLAGVPARPYHYGMYMLPALVKQLASLPSYAAFAGLLAPVGVFFSGLAAYAFFGSLWGPWRGFAAMGALLLLPDGSQQGMRNPFMSYHWLTQISPSATYGLSLLAVAWLFVIQGSARGNRVQLFAGWLLAGLAVFYKLHYVVACALLLLLIPALFFPAQLSRRQRATWVGAAAVLYVVSLVFIQKVPGVPLIRFDGSSVGEILRLVQSFALPGVVRSFMAARTGSSFSRFSNLVFGIPYVLLAVFGLIAPLFAVLVVHLRKRLAPIQLLFPLLLLANFLTMFFGLALDFASSTPDELSHRPLMLVYFFVVSWVGGALGLIGFEHGRLNGNARPASKRVDAFVAIGLAAVLMLVPARLGPGVQLMWAMPKISPVRLPIAWVQVAEFLRSHGGPEDVFQDSQFDRTYALAALSERRTFAAHTMTRMDFRSDMLEARSNAIDHFMGIRQAKLVSATARALGFRWFVLHPGDRVDWPREVANSPAVQIGPFRIYEF